MTSNELKGITVQLQIEQLLCEKYEICANSTQSQELKKTCEKIIAQHKNHYTSLLNLLN